MIDPPQVIGISLRPTAILRLTAPRAELRYGTGPELEKSHEARFAATP